MAFCFKNVEGWSENVLWHLSSNNDHTWNKTLNDGSHGFILESTWNKNKDKNKELIFYSFSPLFDCIGLSGSHFNRKNDNP